MEFEGVEILAREVRPGPDCGWTRTGENTAVPTRIVATIYTADPLLRLDIKVNVDWSGRGIVRELTVVTDGPQTGVSITLLRRIPVDTLMRFAMREATVAAIPRPDVSPRAFNVPGDPTTHAWVSGPLAEPGRGKNAPGDRIAKAAEVYRQALASGSKAPAEVVAAKLNYSRATAARDIRKARELGLIPPRGNEDSESAADPTSAIAGTGSITRMSGEEFDRHAQELGLQGPGPKGKRLADLTPDEYAELAERFERFRSDGQAAESVKHPGVPLDGDGTD